MYGLRNRYRRVAAAGTDAEVEALQTDVMRFMAILGLCLVAVFALVQSLPGPAPGEEAADAAAGDSASGTEAALAAARAEMGRLETALGDARAEAARLRENLAATRARMGQAASEQSRTARALAALRAELVRVEGQLAGERAEVARLQAAAAEARAERETARARLAALAADAPPAAEQTPAAPAEHAAEPAPEPSSESGEGPSLRFASEGALRTLVDQGEVTVYAFAADAAWRYVPATRRFVRAEAPIRAHTMVPATVPAAYLRAFQAARADGGTPRWAVTLPATIAQELRARAETRRSGALVIHGDGSVRGGG